MVIRITWSVESRDQWSHTVSEVTQLVESSGWWSHTGSGITWSVESWSQWSRTVSGVIWLMESHWQWNHMISGVTKSVESHSQWSHLVGGVTLVVESHDQWSHEVSGVTQSVESPGWWSLPLVHHPQSCHEKQWCLIAQRKQSESLWCRKVDSHGSSIKGQIDQERCFFVVGLNISMATRTNLQWIIININTSTERVVILPCPRLSTIHELIDGFSSISFIEGVNWTLGQWCVQIRALSSLLLRLGHVSLTWKVRSDWRDRSSRNIIYSVHGTFHSQSKLVARSCTLKKHNCN